ncbi:MAG TPA: hypothetical protein VEY12_11205 [Thermoplasmata archaeon]|nr:hypothetical protein [Thermoplasmata archaeon]
MKPENRALLALGTAVVAVTAVVGAYLLASPSRPTTLVVPWGTVFQAPFGFQFNVTPPGGILLGAWSSTGKTCVFLLPYGSSIPHAVLENCVAEGTTSGTFNENVSSVWSFGYMLAFLSDSPVTVRVTRTIQVVY